MLAIIVTLRIGVLFRDVLFIDIVIPGKGM